MSNETEKQPKNLQAILDWCEANRPDLRPVVWAERNNAGFILLMTVGFEAGRQFQHDNSTFPLNSPHLYLDDAALVADNPTSAMNGSKDKNVLVQIADVGVAVYVGAWVLAWFLTTRLGFFILTTCLYGFGGVLMVAMFISFFDRSYVVTGQPWIWIPCFTLSAIGTLCKMNEMGLIGKKWRREMKRLRKLEKLLAKN